jgi:hypothetical protein
MLRDAFFRKAWFSRLIAATRRGAEDKSETMPIIACDEHGEPEPLAAGEDGVQIHSLDVSGYGVFEDRGFWLVSFAGRWYQAAAVDAPYVPIAASQVPAVLVAAVAHARMVPAERHARMGHGNVAVQTSTASSDT